MAGYGAQLKYNAQCRRANAIVDALNFNHSEELDYFDKPLELKVPERDALRVEYKEICEALNNLEGDFAYEVMTHLLNEKW